MMVEKAPPICYEKLAACGVAEDLVITSGSCGQAIGMLGDKVEPMVMADFDVCAQFEIT